MARVTTVTVSDDLDGGPADETVAFCLDGRSYEIDLSTDNARRLRELLHHYLIRASPLNPTTTDDSGAPCRADTGPRSGSAIVRAWAVANGYPVSRVGRVPEHIERAYAQGGGQPPTTHHPSSTHHRTPADVTHLAGVAGSYPIHPPQQEPTPPEAP